MRSTRSFLLILSFFLALASTPPAIGADSTSFNPTTVTVTAKNAGGGVPVGTIVAWPVANNPEDMDNWLECNGQTVSQTAFPELFAVIGFQVPDYRGLFLRGYGSQVSSHYGTVTHQSGALGQIQGDAVREFSGTFDGHCVGYNTGRGTGPFYGRAVHDRGSAGGDNRYDGGGGWGFDISRVVPTSQENRPVNMAVRYLIRALP